MYESICIIKLNAREVDNLPYDEWENFTEYPRGFSPSYLDVWEVVESVYRYCKAEGWLCMKCKGKYYVAR